MSDATQDLQGTASHPSGDDYKGPVAEPTESYDSEIALNGSRDLLRAGSTVFAGIRKAIEFHAVADGGAGTQAHSPAQVVREVLGTIERAATEASKHQPKWRKSNGMPEFAEFNPAALRQLAALCRVYAGIDPVTPAETVELWVDAHAAVAASIAAHERDVIAEREAERADPAFVEVERERPEMVIPTGGTVTLTVGGVDVDVAERETVDPDPFVSPTPVDTWPANIITPLPNGATLITGPPDPFSNPAPVSHAPDGTDDGIPF